MVYQGNDRERREINGSYVLNGRSETEFKLGEYDRSKTIVIDPILTYGTFLGGSGVEVAQGVAADAAGNAYVMGLTESTDFPTTSNAYQTSGGNPSVFITKLNPAGTALVYSTYLGGCDSTHVVEPSGLAVDSAGSAYVGGARFRLYSDHIRVLRAKSSSRGQFRSIHY